MRRFLLFAVLGLVAAATWGAATPIFRDDEIIRLEWKGASWRVGGRIPVKIQTPHDELQHELHGKNLVMKGSDGRERKLRASADDSKAVRDGSVWQIEADAGALSDTPPPGKFELWYQITEERKTKSLFGTLYGEAKNPLPRLEKESAKLGVLLEMDEGPVLLSMRYDKAPGTVRNFMKLATEGFYEGRVFHRIWRGYIVQGGGYKSDGSMGNCAAVPFEKSDLPHDRGCISMARLPKDPNSATSQFFICLTNQRTALDGKYASFGKVLEGMDVVDRMALRQVTVGPDNENTKPVKPPVIEKATVVELP